MGCKITLTTAKQIDHPDADAAGFEKGVKWRVVDDLGEFESYAPTKAEARERALLVARSHGYEPE